MELVSSVRPARVVPARLLGANYVAAGGAQRLLLQGEVLVAAGGENTGNAKNSTLSGAGDGAVRR